MPNKLHGEYSRAPFWSSWVAGMCQVIKHDTGYTLCSILTVMCRNLRKVNILLQAIDRLGKDVEYYAVDLSLPELERTFSEIPTGKQVSLHLIEVDNIYVTNVGRASFIRGA
jgi:hypothetical protein